MPNPKFFLNIHCNIFIFGEIFYFIFNRLTPNDLRGEKILPMGSIPFFPLVVCDTYAVSRGFGDMKIFSSILDRGMILSFSPGFWGTNAGFLPDRGKFGMPVPGSIPFAPKLPLRGFFL